MRATKIAPIKRLTAQPNRIRVYVDGSSDNHRTLTGGWAAVILVPGERAKTISGFIKPPTNNQVAELTAAVMGLEYVRERRLGGQCEVISDSMYVIRGITMFEATWRLNGWITTNDESVKHQELWKRLMKLDNENVIWKHIRGHHGNVFNEMADHAAGLARTNRLIKNRNSA